MPHIETIEKVGDLRHQLKRGSAQHTLRSGHITSVLKVIISGGGIPADAVLHEDGTQVYYEGGTVYLQYVS